MVEKPKHDLDYSDIDELDEIDEYRQLALVWCRVHEKYEWHWVEIDCLPGRRAK
jgi:hypothetical protein